MSSYKQIVDQLFQIGHQVRTVDEARLYWSMSKYYYFANRDADKREGNWINYNGICAYSMMNKYKQQQAWDEREARNREAKEARRKAAKFGAPRPKQPDQIMLQTEDGKIGVLTSQQLASLQANGHCTWSPN